MQNPDASGSLRLTRSKASAADPSRGFLRWARDLLEDDRKTGLLLLVLFAFGIVVRLDQTINNDVGWYLYSAGAWLDGGWPYQDIFFEVNPPLMLFLTAPAVFAAKLAGFFPAHVYFVYVFALIALSLGLLRRALRGSFPQSPARVGGLILAGFLILVVVPAGDFGQREHLTIVLCLPYVALAASRASGGSCGWPAAVAIGAMAGLGFTMKPYGLVPLFAIETYVLFRTRSLSATFRTETKTLAAVGLLYGGCLILVTPDYLGSVVPYAFEVYNANYRNSLGFVLARKETLMVPLAVALYFAMRRRQEHRSLAEVCLIAMACFFAAYLYQMKGWNYHLYPVTAWLVMSLAALTAGVPAGDRPAPRRADGEAHSILPLGALALIGLLALKPLALPGNAYPLADHLKPLVQKYAGGGSIYFFSSNTWTGFPLVNYSGVRWASRFPALWLLPGVVNDRAREKGAASAEHRAMAARITRFVTDAVVSDLGRDPPALVMVDARPEKPWYSEDGFDFIAFFSADPRFKAFWSHYEKIEDIGGWQVFRRCEAARTTRNFDEFEPCHGS